MEKTLNTKIYSFILAIALILTTSLSAQAEQMLSGNVFSYKNEPFITAVVDKSTNTLYIVEVKDDVPTIIDQTSVLIGGGKGDKMKTGDLKTPEGVYFITGYLSPEWLRRSYGNVADDYGTGAFPLNYPNFFDRISGKTGSGIWIHGKRVDRKEQDTRGCVALENDVLESYKKYLKAGVPVVITNQINLEQLQNYGVEKSFLREKLDSLVLSWMSLDFNEFASHYHIEFRGSSGERYAEYLRKKKVLMDLYPERKIEISNVKAFKENDNEFLYEFDQLYCAENILTYGTKKLYLKREVEELKIVAEEFSTLPADNIIKGLVSEFIEDWRNSWEQRDIDKYMANYSEKFSSDGFNYERWKNDKVEKFAKYSTIMVGIGNLKVSQVGPKKVRVTFTQKYTGDSYSDVGTKTIELEGCPGGYKIVGELWRAR
jgi:murein L,D-transpeptidase YafK